MKISINTLVCFILVLFAIGNISGDQEFDQQPILYTAKHSYPANKDGSGAIYYEINLCPTENSATQIQVSIILSKNFDCQINYGMVLGQFSKVKGNFAEENVIASTYDWNNGDIKASCYIIFPITKDITQLYARFIGWFDDVEASIELTYVNNKTNNNYPYSSKPFSGTIVNDNPIGMMQYWITTTQQSVKYGDANYYKINFCPQTYFKLQQINVVVTSLVSKPYSLFDQGGCTLTEQSGTACQSQSNEYGWYTSDMLPISMYSYAASEINITNGMRAIVYGKGGDENQDNWYVFQAMAFYPVTSLDIHRSRLRQYNQTK